MEGSVSIVEYRVVPASTTVYARMIVTVIGVSVEVTVPVSEASLLNHAATQERSVWDENDLVAVVGAYLTALSDRVFIG
jgi:hypothetical protein